MDPTNQANTNQLIESETARDEMGEFKEQFYDPREKSGLRYGLRVDDIFKGAGFKPMEWRELSSQIQDLIHNKRVNKGAFGVGLMPWEEGKGHSIFGKPEKGTYYLLRKMGNGYAWSRFWLEGETPHFEPIKPNSSAYSSLSEIIDTVAYHEFGEKPQPKQPEAVDPFNVFRNKAKASLHH